MKLEIYFQGFQDKHLNYKTWISFEEITMFQNLGTHKMFQFWDFHFKFLKKND
jgi:hypothetical protein